jgi:hypothetical protein
MRVPLVLCVWRLHRTGPEFRHFPPEYLGMILDSGRLNHFCEGVESFPFFPRVAVICHSVSSILSSLSFPHTHSILGLARTRTWTWVSGS